MEIREVAVEGYVWTYHPGVNGLNKALLTESAQFQASLRDTQHQVGSQNRGSQTRICGDHLEKSFQT